YIPRFNQKEIISLVNSNCSPKFSHEFDSRFDGFDIAFMNDFEIKPIKANKYPQQFKPRQIINFNAQCMEPDDVIKCMNKIDKLNDGYFKFNLKHENIGILLFEVINQNFDINIINNYRKNYYPDDIIELYLQKHYPEKTKLYDKNISSEFLLHSLEQKKDPKTTLNNSIEVNKIINSGGTVTSSPYVEKKDYQKDYIQKKYKINLDNQKSIFLFLDYEKKGLINHIIRDYPESYPIESKLNLYKKGIKPEKCPKFEEFNFLSIHKVEKLIENNIDENELKKLMGLYHATKLEDLIFIKNLNLEKKINIKKLLKLKPAIEQIVKRYKESEDENIKIIGHGASGIIVSSDYLNNKSVSKFSINRKHEYNILRQICHKWKKPRNIISLINIYQIGGAGQTYELLKLHEIDGPNLEEIIQKEKLDYETIISYAADILHGMIEMDLAGVKFHRDIRPANIMLNIKESMLKIIDYGIASCDPNISPRDNRRFGGRNDLDSLGEVIYTMIAKEILFSEFNLKNDSNYANKIKINRDRAFEGKDKKNLKYYYKKIKKNVKYDFFQNFIIDCFKSNDKFELLFKKEKQKKKSKILDWFSKYSPHFTNEDKFTFYMYDINPKRANGYNVEPFDIIRLGSYQVPLTFKNFYSKQ
ncbi:hypothetical protein HN415_04025, partial [Candidatus Woesearchaeota archaeon]|nr:hypothetical protein [Candidatus Woesearchaeota archaeon]